MASGRKFWVSIAVLLAVFGTAFWLIYEPPRRMDREAFGPNAGRQEGNSLTDGKGSLPENLPSNVPAKKLVDNREALANALGLPINEIVTVGGVDRPRRDIQESTISAAAEPNDASSSAGAAEKEVDAPSVESALTPFARIGGSIPLKGDENPQVAGLMKELLGGQQEGVEINKSMRSTFFAPKAFDREAYEKDRQKYLDEISPARAFQPAQPGLDVVPIAAETRAFQHVLQGERVILRVKAEPGVPVAFYTPQVGQFDNLLKSYTVAANEDGIATATWFAGPGSFGVNDILAASPVHSGQLQFRVKVDLPDRPLSGDH